jgi:hypothetical protein
LLNYGARPPDPHWARLPDAASQALKAFAGKIKPGA